MIGRGPVDGAGHFDDDTQVGCAAGEVLADLGLDLAAAQRDAVLAGDGDLVPPFLVALGVGGVSAVGVVAKVVAQSLCDLGDVIGVSLRMVKSLAVGVDVPLAQDAVLGLDRLADEPPAGLVGLQIVLEPFDPAGEPCRVLVARNRELDRCRARRGASSTSRAGC